MSGPTGRQPVRRRVVLGGALGLLAVLGLIVGLGEGLRHPTTTSGIPEDELAGADPRDEVSCSTPLPREGEVRAPQAGDGALAVTSNNLYDCPQSYDGLRVRYRGEAVGGLLEREYGVWIQLNDDVYAELLGPLPAHRDFRGGNAGVGVLLPTHLAGGISFVGGPQTQGDVIEIEGVYHRVDATGEVAVIRADRARIASRGRPFPDPPLLDRQVAAFFAVVLACVVVLTERVVAARR